MSAFQPDSRKAATGTGQLPQKQRSYAIRSCDPRKSEVGKGCWKTTSLVQVEIPRSGRHDASINICSPLVLTLDMTGLACRISEAERSRKTKATPLPLSCCKRIDIQGLQTGIAHNFIGTSEVQEHLVIQRRRTLTVLHSAARRHSSQ